MGRRTSCAARRAAYLDGEQPTPSLTSNRRALACPAAWRTSWQDLKDKFRECGEVVYANVIKDDAGACPREWAPLGEEENSKPLDSLHCPVWAAVTWRLQRAGVLRHAIVRATGLGSLRLSDCGACWLCAGRSKGWGIVEYASPEEVRKEAEGSHLLVLWLRAGGFWG